MNKFCVCLLSVVLGGTALFGQATKTAKAAAGKSVRQNASASAQRPGQNGAQPRPHTPQQRFVVDVVRSAVALPQADPQDRLRVLTAAANVAGPVSPQIARQYTREGARIEAELIAAGQVPNVSILSAGYFDCSGAAAFIDQVPASGVAQAEQSLINLMSSCSRQAKEGVRRKVEAALSQGVLASRALLALMEATGPKSAWSQTSFANMFGNLPKDAERVREEAPNYAAMFNRMAPEMDKDIARDTGLRFLEWLSKAYPVLRRSVNSLRTDRNEIPSC